MTFRQLTASPPKWCRLCWLHGCAVHLMEEPTYIQAACRFTHIDLSWRIKKSTSSTTNTCVRKVYKCFYVINAKYISILYNGVFFLRNKRSIVVIFGIFCVREETRMDMCSIRSGDSALLSEKHGVGQCVYKLSTFNPGLLKLYITGSFILCLKWRRTYSSIFSRGRWGDSALWLDRNWLLFGHWYK